MARSQIELQRARATLGSGQAEAAARACQKLLSANPRDIDARYLHGRCLAAQGRWRDAAFEFRRVLAARSDFFTALVDLGIAETFQGNYHGAQILLEHARTLDPRPAELHFAIGLCRMGFDDYLGAANAFRDAISRNPRFPDALNNLGVACDRIGRMAEAAEHFRQAAAIRGDFVDAHRNLGDVLSRQGDSAGAVMAFQRAADLQPNDSAARAELGAAQLAARDFAAAAATLEQALMLDAKLAGAAANLGEALRNLRQDEKAVAALRHALAVDPSLAEAHLGLGKLAAARDDAAAAARELMAAAKMKPADSKIALAAAADLEQLGWRSEALGILRTAAGAQPGSADVYDALGALLQRLGQLPEALDCYERALEIDGERVQTHLNCGYALEAIGAYQRAIACYRQALALRPADARTLGAIASCAFRLCEWELSDSMVAALRQLPEGIDELHPFLMLAADLGPAETMQSLRRRSRAATPTAQLQTRPVCAPHAPHDRLRIAYVSPDFRAHPVGYALAGVIEHHDRARVVPIGVSLSAGDGSAIGTRLKTAFDEFIDVSSLSDREAVKLMREREIDVAIDLAGLTTGARCAIFNLRAAPIQINYLGFPGSMGTDCMDFIIADRIVAPASDEAFFLERVLRMPDSYLPFDDSRIVAPAGITREAAGLPPSGFVFCAFNNGYKITRAMFEVWMSLLRDVPGSVLWLRSMGGETAASLKHAASALGISADRLVFASFVEAIDAHLSRLQLADLFLDTLPYNAHTTAAEALWAGVPVITCRGRTFAGRVGASLLTACDQSELICADLEAYRMLALRIAKSPELRAGFQTRLRGLKSSAKLFNAALYTRNLEDLLFSAKFGGVAARNSA
jgi:protein O-GlcNAc transferase